MATSPSTEQLPAYTSIVTSRTWPAPTEDSNIAPPTPSLASEFYELEFNKVDHTTALHIDSQGSTLYYVGHYKAQNTADIIIYAGYDSNGPRLAHAQFISHSKDFKVYVGDFKNPSYDDWDVVRCADGSIFKDPSYRFDCRSKGEGGRSVKSRYYWKKTSDRNLGASKTSPRDFKLVDESNETVAAVYIEHHQGTRSKRGTLSFRQALNPKAELMALLALLSLLEKSRRHMRQVVNAFPSTNSY